MLEKRRKRNNKLKIVDGYGIINGKVIDLTVICKYQGLKIIYNMATNLHFEDTLSVYNKSFYTFWSRLTINQEKNKSAKVRGFETVIRAVMCFIFFMNLLWCV